MISINKGRNQTSSCCNHTTIGLPHGHHHYTLQMTIRIKMMEVRTWINQIIHVLIKADYFLSNVLSKLISWNRFYGLWPSTRMDLPTNIWKQVLHHSTHLHFDYIRNKGTTMTIGNTCYNHSRDRCLHNNAIFARIVWLHIKISVLRYRIMIITNIHIRNSRIMKSSSKTIDGKPSSSCKTSIHKRWIWLDRCHNIAKSRQTKDDVIFFLLRWPRIRSHMSSISSYNSSRSWVQPSNCSSHIQCADRSEHSSGP